MCTTRLIPLASTITCALLAALTLPTPTNGAEPVNDGQLRVYFGTYSGGNSKGIYRADLDLKTGQLTTPELAAETVNPSFLAIHPSGKFLYSVGEIGDFKGGKGGAVNAFAIDPKSGDLKLLNQQSSGGGGPCYVAVDAAGKNVLVANYGGGSVACLPIAKDGSLEEASSFIQHEGSSDDPARQSGPHAHSINLDAKNRFAVAADLGLDKLLVYKFDAAKGKLTPNDPPSTSVEPKSGPRHFDFHPSGRFAYVINEMALTVTAFTYDAEQGVLKSVQTISTVPKDVKGGGNSTAQILVHPSGKFVYGSNRGPDSIAIFAVDEKTGKLTAEGHQPTGGKTPRNFNIDPTGQYLLAANQDSSTVVVFRIDQQTGQLKPVGTPLAVPKPVCVEFLSP